MKHKTTTEAIDPKKYYLRILYCEWFYEFNSIDEIKEFVVYMDKEEPMWDYDCYGVHKGDPRWRTDKDFGCFDFKFISKKQRKEIEDCRV